MKTTIVFDWGNTLMEVFPDYVGPVQSWQTVKTAPGARQVLEVLALQYNLVIATNASDSNSTQVWQALDTPNLPNQFVLFSSPRNWNMETRSFVFHHYHGKTGSMPRKHGNGKR